MRMIGNRKAFPAFGKRVGVDNDSAVGQDVRVGVDRLVDHLPRERHEQQYAE